MWHVAAALAPLPLIALGYASIPGNKLAFRMELMLSGNGSSHALTRDADASEHVPLPRAAAVLFRTAEKGPRADQYLTVKTTTYADKQFITASVSGADAGSNSGDVRDELIRDRKSDRLNAPVTEVALRSGGGSDRGVSMFTEFTAGNLELAPALAGAPSPQTIAYHPSAEGLNFKYKGESQAEFEERERRCLATAIYFEARGEPVQGQIAVGQVILNRVRSPNFPETICGVVYQGQMSPGCQFSFTCDGKTDTPKNDSPMGARPEAFQADHLGPGLASRDRLFDLLPCGLCKPAMEERHEQDRHDRAPHLLQEAQREALYRGGSLSRADA